MYKLIPIILSLCMFVLSFYMINKPKEATKKELRDDEKMIEKTRKNGIIVLACAITLLILGIMRIKG